jgi:NAD(P)-dependent dehydrogenase (short-subunit alcohol dehydrogenase family)
MDALADKVAVVTGAANGIGFALCEALAAESMRVVMSDVDPAALEAAAARIDGEVLAFAADVMKWDEVAELESRAVERFGAVDVLCNNAGVQLPGLTWEFTREEWEWVLGVNLGGVVHCLHAFLPGMVARGEPGHIVNIAPYTAAKYAVVGLSESMRADLRGEGVDISVSVLCPGPVLSRLRENSAAFQPGGESGRDVPVLTEPRMPAEDVAAQVVDAIRNNRFWILTHPEYNDTIRERCRGIVDTNDTVVAELR